MRLAKPHFHLTSLIYIPFFLLSAYLVLFHPYWILKSISIVCFFWLITLLLLTFSNFGNKAIGTITEATIISNQQSFFLKTVYFQLFIFITLIGGLFAIHSFISPQIIIFPGSYAFFIFFSWVIYLLFAAAFICFESEQKLSFVNRCLTPLMQINFFKRHENTLKVIQNTYFFQANFIWFATTFALLLFAITRFSGMLLHTHIASNFDFKNIVIASLLFLILSNKGWVNFIKENAYQQRFLILFISVSSFLLIVTNVLSWLFFHISNFFSFSSLRVSFSLYDWFHWIDSTILNQIFIWFWLLGFCPYIALKTVEVYRGSTIKKMITQSLILPSLISLGLLFLPSFTMLATTTAKQILILVLFVTSFSLIVYAFLTESNFQKIFFSRVSAEDKDTFQNIVQASKGIFQNIVALFILVLLFGLLILSIIVPITFFPVWLLTILLCVSILYAIRQSKITR